MLRQVGAPEPRRHLVARRGSRADGPRGRRAPGRSTWRCSASSRPTSPGSAPISTPSSSTISAWPSGARARCSARSSTCFRPTPSSTSRPSSRGSVASPARRATWTCSSSRSESAGGDLPAGDMEALTGVPGPDAAAGAPRRSSRRWTAIATGGCFGVGGVPRATPPRQPGAAQRGTPARGRGLASAPGG